MGRLVLAFVLVIGCSCSVTINASTPSPTPVAATVAPSPSSVTSHPTSRPTTPSNVLAIAAGPGDVVRLVASYGTVLATTTYDPAPFRAHAFMSWTSASLTRLYYLNGGSEVRFLERTGTTGSATRISVGAFDQAGFAVSPDDKRIAVSIFNYTPAPSNSQGFAQPTYKGMRMYVEDLQGGGHHVDIFASTTVAEFPIGWSAGRLVIAVSTPLCCHTLPFNPYAASTYHVVSAENGDRLASLCDGSAGPSGPVEPIGTMCLEYQGGPSYRRWDGSPFMPPSAVQTNNEYLNALSPDGTWSAIGGTPIQLQHREIDDRLPESGYVFGWLDGNYLVFQRTGAATLSVFDLTAFNLGYPSSTDLPGAQYLGTFPAAIS